MRDPLVDSSKKTSRPASCARRLVTVSVRSGAKTFAPRHHYSAWQIGYGIRRQHNWPEITAGETAFPQKISCQNEPPSETI